MKSVKYNMENPARIIAGVVAAKLLIGCYLLSSYGCNQNKPEVVTETKIVYKERTPQQKWNSLAIEDKMYFLKTGHNDLPNGAKKQVCSYLLDEINQNHSDHFTSKVYKFSKFLDDKFSEEKKHIPKYTISKNMENIESFLWGERK